mgnify:CR=1 FL=1
MAKMRNDHFMTGREIADTFNDHEVLERETRMDGISADLRLGRSVVIDIADEDQSALDAWVEDLMKESRENTERIREIRKARSESIGMKIR